MAKAKVEKSAIVEGNKDIAANGIFGNRVMASMGKTINLGDNTFESIRVDYAECRVVQDGESFEAARTKVRTDVWVEFLDMVTVIEDALK